MGKKEKKKTSKVDAIKKNNEISTPVGMVELGDKINTGIENKKNQINLLKNNNLLSSNNYKHQKEDDEKDDGDDIQLQQIKQIEQIEKTGMVTSTNGHHMIHCLTIIGQVEGHYILPSQNKTTKYEYVIPQLIAIEETPEIKGLIIILNTVGGDVEAGLAIAELIAGMKKPTVSLVLGGGHSIGVPLAVSAKKSFIVPSATMTIHPVRMSGVVLGIPQAFSYFDRMQDRIIKFVVNNSSMTQKKFRELLMNTSEMVNDVGTVLDGEKAVEEGLIDKLGGLSDALDELYRLIDMDSKK